MTNNDKFNPNVDAFHYTTFVGYKGQDVREEKANWNNLKKQFINPVSCEIAEEFQASSDTIYSRKKHIASNELRYISGGSYKILSDSDWLRSIGKWTYRLKDNLDTVYILTMDFDDESNERRVYDLLRKLKIKSIIYPSAGNGYSKFCEEMANKHDDKFAKGKVDKKFDRRLIGKTIYKYRVIVPLAVPISADDWDTDSIKWHAPTVFGAIDTSCFNKAHSQGMPVTCFHDPIRYEEAIRIFDEGCEFFDISDWPKKPVQTHVSSSGGTYRSSGNGVCKTETFHHDRVLERPDGSTFTYDDMLDGTEEPIICPFEAHTGRTQTAKIWRHIDGNAQIFCQKTNCIGHDTVRMAQPLDISLFAHPNTDLDMTRFDKPKVERGYDENDLYNGLSLSDGTLVSSLSPTLLKKAFKKMKSIDSVYFDVKKIVLRNERYAESGRDVTPLFLYGDFDDDDVRSPTHVERADRLLPGKNKGLKTLLEKTQLGFNYDRIGRYLLMDEEGSGKSSFALYMAGVMGQKVGFFCASWDQAHEQCASFTDYCETHGVDIDIMVYRSRAQIIKSMYPEFEVVGGKSAPFESSVMHESDYLTALSQFMTKIDAVDAYTECQEVYQAQKDRIADNNNLFSAQTKLDFL